MRQSWAICQTCDKWNETPPDFKETKHFCMCVSCGGSMFLVRSDPHEAAYRDHNKTEIRLTPIKERP